MAIPAKDAAAALAHYGELVGPDFFQSVLDGIQDAVKIVDEEFQIVYTNAAGERRSGKGSSELTGKACFREFYALEHPCPFCHTKRAFETGEKEVSAYEAPGADGAMQYYELTSYPIKDASAKVRFVVEITKDVTDRKRLEQQLLHAERLSTMGTLASSLAHEINNPLSVIVGFAQDLLTELPKDCGQVEGLKIIEQEALRCGRVLQRLLNFTRAHPPELADVEPGKLMQTAMALVRPQAKKLGIETRLRIAKTLPALPGDPTQLEQLFLNLALNALQAMPTGGRLTLQADPAEGAVRFIVADTGHGIDAEDLPRVFEPFFSKRQGAGTGLGLAVAKRIVDGHRGSIRLESEPGKGTRAVVVLPVGG